MLSLSEIKSFFPEPLHRFPRFMLREYLQVKILDIIFRSPYSDRLCFLGGTCLRIVHGNRRFSEDLDFDNLGLEKRQFSVVADAIQTQLQREGFDVELRSVMHGAWHCYIKFPGLLFKEGLSGVGEEKILIQLDMEPQHVLFEPERYILNRFEIFTTILTTPLPLLLSQKLYAIMNRKRKMGRDFFDVVFLLGKDVLPDYSFLKKRVNIADAPGLKQKMIEICQSLNLDTMARDVEPFLFSERDKERVLRFEEYIRQAI